MKSRILLIGAVQVSLIFAAPTLPSQTGPAHAPVVQQGVKYQPLDVKPGLWEKTATYKIAGNLPIPAGMLDKLTPEQRARFEARMNARSSGNTRTSTEQSCVTRQQLEDPIDFGDKNCTLTILESTTSKASGNIVCKLQGMEMSGKAEFLAVDQEHITGSEHVTSTGGGNSMTTDVSFTSKWLGSNCGNAQ